MKSNKCLIHLEGQEAFPGDKFFALNLTGEKVGIVEIEKAKNGKAIGRIIQGVAESNWILEKTAQINPVLDVSKNQAFLSSSLSNSIGFYLTGSYSQLILATIKGTSPMSHFNSLSGGGALFTDFRIASQFMLHLQVGGEYVQLKGISSRSLRSQQAQSSFLLWSIPLTLQYYVPINNPRIKLWIGPGVSLNFWGNEREQEYEILNKESAYNKFSNSIHLTLGVDFYPSQDFYIPLRIQGTNHFFFDFLQRSVLGNEETRLTLNQFSIFIGIARNI